MELVKLLPKNENFEIAYKLGHDEFRCKCKYETCVYTLINPRLIIAWIVIRALFGKSLTINSGFRCQLHNNDSGGVYNSKHKEGKALDISFKNLTPMEKTFLKTILETHFDVVIEYLDFFHCHIN